MVKKGQTTQDEADRLRQASDPEEFEVAVRAIRARHAYERLDGGVKDGTMSREEAGNVIERIKEGEHSRSFRLHLRQLLHGKGSGN